MSFDSMELVSGFVEDSREHLDNIEQSLLDIESAGEAADEELVNAVFRAAHSIKGGAGMLGYENIKELAHKLENVLHMVRSGEVSPSHEVVDVLLKGFDRLSELISDINGSETMPIDEQVAQLVAVVESGLSEEDKGLLQQSAPITVEGRHLFAVDALSLAQAQKGGNNIYLLEYDLIHDIHGQDKTPWQVLKSLLDGGQIVDSRVDFEAVGSLDDDFENRIPLYVLYATILEQDFMPGLVHLDASRIKSIESARKSGDVSVLEKTVFGPFELKVDEGLGRVALPEAVAGESVEDLRQALLAGMERCENLVLDVSEQEEGDVFFFQLLCVAQRDFSKAGKLFGLVGTIKEDLRLQARAMGFVPEVWRDLGATETVL